ncbi:MAG: hypothetical protein QGG64_14430, partial [Candidatus Latescibacteria bacterium]|nr:hypothetical protein [Candidatus Latescibacterota bacterium]
MRLGGFVILVLIVGVVMAISDEDELFPIQNANFETGNGQVMADWAWWSRTDHGSAIRVSDVVHSEKYAVRIEHDGQRDWAFSSSTRFSVKPGTG